MKKLIIGLTAMALAMLCVPATFGQATTQKWDGPELTYSYFIITNVNPGTWMTLCATNANRYAVCIQDSAGATGVPLWISLGTNTTINRGIYMMTTNRSIRLDVDEVGKVLLKIMQPAAATNTITGVEMSLRR